jgi:hypothetical protein
MCGGLLAASIYFFMKKSRLNRICPSDLLRKSNQSIDCLAISPSCIRFPHPPHTPTQGMPADQPDDGDPQAWAEAGAAPSHHHQPPPEPNSPPRVGGGGSGGGGGGGSAKVSRLGRLSSIKRLASSSSVSFRLGTPEPIDAAQEDAEELDMANADIVRELISPAPLALKTSRGPPSAVAPYGPDEPMSLQQTGGGASTSLFNMAYVPSISQSMAKVRTPEERFWGMGRRFISVRSRNGMEWIVANHESNRIEIRSHPTKTHRWAELSPAGSSCPISPSSTRSERTRAG